MTKPTSTRKLFHVSPQANLSSILEHGVLPSYSQGKRAVSWFVDRNRLPWAIAHVSDRREISVHGLMVYTVLADAPYFRRTRLFGVYTASQPLFVWSYDSAITMLQPDSLT